MRKADHPNTLPLSVRASSLISQLDRVRRDAEESWTPGQALGEILSYLERIENFTTSELTASSVQKRMRWLTGVLRAAVERARAAGLDPEIMNGVLNALYEHDLILGAERAVVAESAKAVRDLIRLEVTYIGLRQQQR